MRISTFVILSFSIGFYLLGCKENTTKNEAVSDSTIQAGNTIPFRDVTSFEYQTIRGIITSHYDTLDVMECITNKNFKIVDSTGLLKNQLQIEKSKARLSKIYCEMEIIRSLYDSTGVYQYNKLIKMEALNAFSHCGVNADVVITGIGNEPGWKMDIEYSDAPQMPYNLLLDYGQSKMSGQLTKKSGNLKSSPMVLETKDGNGEILRVSIDSKPCSDDAGKDFNGTMTVTYLGKTYRGCADIPR